MNQSSAVPVLPMSRADRMLVCLAAGLASGACLATVCAVVMDPSNGLWSLAQARWSFVHWSLAGRWTYDFIVAAWGFTLGALAAWRQRQAVTPFTRWGVLAGMVVAAAVVAALSVLVFPPTMGSPGSGAGALLEVAVDAVSIVLFVALNGALLLFGGGLALGVGRLVRALADGVIPSWATTAAFALSMLGLLLAGAASPRTLGAPVAVLACAGLAGIAAWSARTRRVDLAVAATGVVGAVFFALQTRSALAWEQDRVRRTDLPMCFGPTTTFEGVTGNLAGIPGLLDAVEVWSAAPQHPVIYFLPVDGADPAALAAAIRDRAPPCSPDADAFDPGEVLHEVLPAAPTPLAFHYLLLDDAEAIPPHVATLVPGLRDALVPRPDSGMRVQGNGSRELFGMPRAMDGVTFQNVCGSFGCRTGTDVNLTQGHYPAFGSVDVVALADVPGPSWAWRGAIASILGALKDVSTDRARELRARYRGVNAFLLLQPSNEDLTREVCQALETAIGELAPKSTDPETLYWAAREAGECAAASPVPPDQGTRLLQQASLLLAHAPASGAWGARAAALRATLHPAGGPVDLAHVKAALDRIPAAEAADPLVELDTLTGYACPAHDAALVTRIVGELRKSTHSATDWLSGTLAEREATLENCATTAR